MKRDINFRHEFVEFMPDSIDEGTLYVSMEYATVIHRCCCGCGNKVVTPLSPTDWTLTFDGHAITLDPSIGNWGFPCRSHYWIKGGKVRWSADWSHKRIEAGRARDRHEKERYFGNSGSPADENADSGDFHSLNAAAATKGLFRRLFGLFRS